MASKGYLQDIINALALNNYKTTHGHQKGCLFNVITVL